MRTNVLRCMLINLVVVALSGCYSDGKWSMPGFTKSSPFQTSPDAATPGPVGSPTKPAGIAASTAPPSQYNNSLNPPVVSYPSTAPSYAGGTANVPQYAYPPTSPAQSAGYPGLPASLHREYGWNCPHRAYGASPGYSAGNQAVPASSYGGASVPTAPYGTPPTYNGGVINMPPSSTQPYTPPPSRPYSTGAASPYPTSTSGAYPPPAMASYPSASASPAGYAAGATSSSAWSAPPNGYPTTTTSTLTNPIRPPTSYPSSQASYPSSQASVPATGAGTSTLDRYSAAVATRGNSAPTGIPVDRGNNGTGNFVPGSYGSYDRSATLPSSSGSLRNADGFANPASMGTAGTASGSVPLTSNRYATPGVAPPSTGSSPYSLSASANSSAMGSGSASLPSSSLTPNSNGAIAQPEYRPGGTSDYSPAGIATPTSTTLPSSASTVGASSPGYVQSPGIQ